MERNEKEARERHERVTESTVGEAAVDGLQQSEPEKKSTKKQKTKEKEVET